MYSFSGVWSSRDELIKLRKIDRTFIPRPEQHEKCLARLRLWEKAVDRFKGWYNPNDLEHKMTY